MRKIFVILLVMIAITASIASFWVIFKKSEDPLANTLYDAITHDVAVVVDIRNYGELCGMLRENELWKQMSKMVSIEALHKDMILLDSLFLSCEHANSLRGNIVFSLHPSGNEEMKAIGYAHLNSEKEASLAGNKLQELRFSFAFRNGIFVFSRSPELIENAVKQIADNRKITQNQNLIALKRTAGKNAPANIYLNFSYLQQTALTFLHTRHSNSLESLKRFADWAELDLNIRTDMMVLNGFIEQDSAKNQWLETFVQQQPLPNTLVEAMPPTTYAYLWMGIDNLEQYLVDHCRHLENNRITARKAELERLNTSYRIDLQKDIVEILEHEIALVFANTGQPQPHNEPFVIFRISDASAATAMIEGWQSDASRGATDNEDKRILTLENDDKHTAYRMTFDVPGIIFGNIFAGKNQWCAVVNNYLVFSSSSANLQKFLQQTDLNANLQTNTEYRQLSGLISERSNIMFYCNPTKMEGLLENLLNDNKNREIQQTKMQAVVYQLNTDGGKIYNNLIIKFPSTAAANVRENQGIRRETNAAETEQVTVIIDNRDADNQGLQPTWEVQLDAAVSNKPYLVRNHNNNEMEIFVQDAENNIYLINNAGRIQWKVNLPEQILSPVYQVDILRNGRLQMLFNTKNFIYVVDRLGNFVNRFPIRLSSPAVGNVALFDYENNRDYRIMVACEDRRVYLFDRTGSRVDGWSFRQTDHPVQTDLYHFRTGNRDYIVFADKNSVYILDRQGRTRVTPEYNLPTGQQTAIALDRQNSRLALTDTTGTVHFISLSDGKMSQQRFNDFPSSHQFIYQDINNDGQGDFIFVYGNKVEVFRQDSRKILEIETTERIILPPQIFEFAANDHRIGIVQPQNNQIWLYDSSGRLSNGFPLRGNTLFTIGRLQRANNNFNLIVGNQNNIYNYTINR